MKTNAVVPALVMIGGLAVFLGACSTTDPPLDGGAGEPAVLLSLSPQGGETDVDRFAPITVQFDHPVMPGMEAYALLHEGDVTGPAVPGVWTMSADGRTLTFTPESPLAPHSTYTVHLGGGILDENGYHTDLGTHGHGLGGAWATQTMMAGGSMGPGMMGGVLGQGHMGAGWQHPNNGAYGMVFTFVTGS